MYSLFLLSGDMPAEGYHPEVAMMPGGIIRSWASFETGHQEGLFRQR
jgi:hypothetical protein